LICLYDAVFVIECSDITRPGLIDLEKQLVVNIDHHSTTALFWRDQLDRLNCVSGGRDDL